MATRPAPLKTLDLNLLVALDALLTERNVTRAAERLALTQPTLSASLRRLRAHFDDDLLERRGNRYELTALARDLRPLVISALAHSERVFAYADGFDPAVSDREFALRAADFWIADLGALLVRELRAHAPGLRLRLGEPPALLRAAHPIPRSPFPLWSPAPTASPSSARGSPARSHGGSGSASSSHRSRCPSSPSRCSGIPVASAIRDTSGCGRRSSGSPAAPRRSPPRPPPAPDGSIGVAMSRPAGSRGARRGHGEQGELQLLTQNGRH